MPVSLYCLCMLEVPSREQEQCPTSVVSSQSPGLQPPATTHMAGPSVTILVRLLLTTVYLMFSILPSYVMVHYQRYTADIRSLVTGHCHSVLVVEL